MLALWLLRFEELASQRDLSAVSAPFCPGIGSFGLDRSRAFSDGRLDQTIRRWADFRNNSRCAASVEVFLRITGSFFQLVSRVQTRRRYVRRIHVRGNF